MKVAVLGAAGGIGQPLSLLLKTQLPAGTELALFDIAPVTPGVAKDLSHIPTPVLTEGYGADDLHKALEGADIVLIPAGVPRKPGMTRADLFNVNAGVAKTLAEAIADVCPTACIGIITNPVNTTVAIAAEVLKAKGCYDKNKLFGVTTLDVIRAETFIAEAKGLDPVNVSLNVIGGHSGVTILPLLSQLDVEFSDEEVAAMTHRIQNAGTEVVEAKAGGGSATLSMAQAAVRFCLSLIKGMNGEEDVVECAYVDGGSEHATFFAQPVKLGKDGIAEVLPYGELSDFEKEALEGMLETLRGDIAKGVEFINA